MKTRNIRLALSCLTLLLAASVQSYAGGPLALRDAGAPFRWPGGGLNIPWNPDQGGLGILTNAQAIAQTKAAFKTWEDIPSASATHAQGVSLPIDVDETNFGPYLEPVAPDGLSAIVYDEDGAIFDLLFGPGSGVLGFAGPEWVNTSTGDILEGVAFMNGAEVASAADIPIFQAVQVHEFGHYQNLAHSVVNGQILAFGDQSGPTPNNTFPGSASGQVETMYPFLFAGDAGGAVTPHADDIAIFSHLYPAPTFASSTGTITGTILAPNGTTPLTGVNVIARNVANPYIDAVSAISSDFAVDYTPGQPFVGAYTLRGLTPGATYAVYVDEILAGGFSTPPLSPLPAAEEFYNGANESSNSATDNPAVFTGVLSIPGNTASGVNIIFNKLLPGPIPVGDDSSVQLFPPFPIEMCGQRFDSLFVNGNGNVTFGGGDQDFSESPGEHLRGLPRLAGLWDDLDPSSGGVISFSETATTFTVTFSGVPEFNTTNSNTFSIKLFKKIGSGPLGNLFRLDYGTLAATDGLAGYSCGGRVTSGFEGETDLEAFAHFPLAGIFETTVYENFTAADNDLDNKSIQFVGTFEPEDLFENNNTRAKAKRVDLPFNSSTRLLHTEIEPTGGDVDYFKFHGKAGEIFVAETVPGLPDMDTVIGLFNSSGTLIAGDDDGGAGLLSRLAVQLPANGDYYVAVSTFPDLTFTGAGEDFGRYVLTMNTYTGTLLPLVDDESVQIPLNTFTFPYQGVNRTSVFVNSNGNLTFGAANDDFAETVAGFLGGPPRIAPLWDDLFPGDGLVIAEEKDKALYIHFVTVPEFFSDSPNYFTVVLDKKGDITMDYGATSRSDGIVGVTKGGGAANPGPRDLSDASSLSAVGTTYEQFIGSTFGYGGVDLSFKQLKFKK